MHKFSFNGAAIGLAFYTLSMVPVAAAPLPPSNEAAPISDTSTVQDLNRRQAEAAAKEVAEYKARVAENEKAFEESRRIYAAQEAAYQEELAAHAAKVVAAEREMEKWRAAASANEAASQSRPCDRRRKD